VLQEQWLKYSDGSWFSVHPIPNVNKYTAVTNLQVPISYLNCSRVKDLLLCCNALKGLVKQLAVKLQHTDF